MSSSRRVVLFLDLVLVCAFFLLETTGTHAAAQDSPNGVVAALERKYVITEMTPDHAEVTKDGTIMVVKRGGLYSDPVSHSLATINNNVVDGKIQPLSGTGLWAYSKSDRILHSGDRVYVLKIESKPDSKGDQLKILILTTDPMDVPGQDGQHRFGSVITFKFNKGYLNEASPEDVAQAVENILAPDTGSAESPGGPAQAQQAVARPVNPDTAARVAALRAQCQQQLAALRAQAQQQSSDITAAQLAALRRSASSSWLRSWRKPSSRARRRTIRRRSNRRSRRRRHPLPPRRRRPRRSRLASPQLKCFRRWECPSR